MASFFALILAAFFAVTALAVPAAPAATPVRPPSGTPKVEKVAVDNPNVDTEGSGCRAGTVGVAFASDNSALTLIYDNFAAGVGPNSGSLRKRAFCRVNATMSSPGWAFDVSSVDFRSYVKVAKGVEASLVTRWKWIDSKGVDMKGKVSEPLFCVFGADVFVAGQCQESSGWAIRRRLPPSQRRRTFRQRPIRMLKGISNVPA